MSIYKHVLSFILFVFQKTNIFCWFELFIRGSEPTSERFYIIWVLSFKNNCFNSNARKTRTVQNGTKMAPTMLTPTIPRLFNISKIIKIRGKNKASKKSTSFDLIIFISIFLKRISILSVSGLKNCMNQHPKENVSEYTPLEDFKKLINLICS